MLNEQEALAEEARQIEKYRNAIEIAKAKRDYELKQAGFDLDVNINKAKADFAYQLQVILLSASFFFRFGNEFRDRLFL